MGQICHNRSLTKFSNKKSRFFEKNKFFLFTVYVCGVNYAANEILRKNIMAHGISKRMYFQESIELAEDKSCFCEPDSKIASAGFLIFGVVMVRKAKAQRGGALLCKAKAWPRHFNPGCRLRRGGLSVAINEHKFFRWSWCQHARGLWK